MVVFAVCACFPGTDDKPAMGKTTMISLHFFLTDEVDRRIVVTEVVWHGYDSLCHSLSIGTFFKDSKNFTRMFFPRRKFRVLAGTNRVKSGFHGNGVLLGVLDTGNAANRVTVALADAFAPEGIVLPYGKNGMAIDAGKGKQARVPANGDDPDVICFLTGCINGRKMVRNAGMCIKAIHHVEFLYILRRLFRQVRCTAAADNEDIDLILVSVDIVYGDDGNTGRFDADLCRVTAAEDRDKFHIRTVSKGQFNTTAQISVAHDGNSRFHIVYPSM